MLTKLNTEKNLLLSAPSNERNQYLSRKLAHTGSFENYAPNWQMIDTNTSLTERRKSKGYFRPEALERNITSKNSNRRISDNVKSPPRLEEDGLLIPNPKAPLSKISENYGKKNPRKKKTNSINYLKSKEKGTSSSSHHSRKHSEMQVLHAPNSASNILPQKTTKSRKQSRSNSRKDRKLGATKSKFYQK